MVVIRQAFAVLPAKDYARAKAWYAEKLGISPAMEMGPGAIYYFGSTGMTLYQSEFAGTAETTQAGLVVDDLAAAMAELRSRGVEFDDVDVPDGPKTVNGVSSDESGGKAAWFTDSEGNIVNLVELPPGFPTP